MGKEDCGEMTNPITYTHYPLSVATVAVTTLKPWQVELTETVNKMLSEINEPYDGSVRIQIQVTRKIVSLQPYKTVKMENVDG